MKLGYARVSTDDQSLEIQHGRLAAAGCEWMFEEKISGTVRGRPALEKLIDHLRKDDVLVVTRLDRLDQIVPGVGRAGGKPVSQGLAIGLDEVAYGRLRVLGANAGKRRQSGEVEQGIVIHARRIPDTV